MIHMSDRAGDMRLVPARGPGSSRRGGLASGTSTLSITSGKGGVGKTQLVANLGVALAQQGRSVLLVDADLGLASLDLALGLSVTSDLMSVVRGDTALSDIVVEGPAGIKVVPACPGRYDMANMTEATRQRIISALHELAFGYDVVLIDTGAGLGANTVEFAALGDDVVLLATPEPTSLRDAYAMAKVLHRRNHVQRVQFVANQVSGEIEGAELFERLSGIISQFMDLELSYLGSIPLDKQVRDSVADGVPFVKAAPQCQASRAVSTIVRRLGIAGNREVLC